MTHRVISVDRLSKQFAVQPRGVDSARGALARALRTPLRGFTRAPQPPTASRGSVLQALDNVSFEVHAGDVMAVMGRNGAGKSVLMKILARVLRPTAGRAEIRGRVAPLLEVGTGFHPDLSGRDNIFLNGAILGLRREEVHSRLDEIVAFSGAADYLDEPVKHYSSGMRMRLAFAVAVHLDRDIFLLDEVLAVGDREFQERCLERLRELAVQGRTILFVSHRNEIVERLCTRALLLEQGRLIADGRPVEVARQYGALYKPGAPPQALRRLTAAAGD